jgi:nitrate/nitrite transporter NarK
MIAGTLCYGPMDRLIGSRKWVILPGHLICGLLCLLLAWVAPQSAVLSVGLMAAIGFFGASFPMIIAHARSFFPAHLTGRGVTLLNLFGIGGAGIMQFVTGPIHSHYAVSSATTGYSVLFAFFGVLLLIGAVIYLFSQDSMD